MFLKWSFNLFINKLLWWINIYYLLEYSSKILNLINEQCNRRFYYMLEIKKKVSSQQLCKRKPDEETDRIKEQLSTPDSHV